jgi:hypothetical protein
MNPRLTLIVITIFAGIIGCILYAINHQWIIIQYKQSTITSSPSPKTKKERTFYYWHNNRWHTETQELIWSAQLHDNIEILVANWLSLLDAEQIIPKKVTVQSIALSPTQQELYISFDRNLMPKEWSIRQKWMLIEGLLKTFRNNDIPLNTIHFFVHHQPMIDAHLDFSCSWPLSGFAST